MFRTLKRQQWARRSLGSWNLPSRRQDLRSALGQGVCSLRPAETRPGRGLAALYAHTPQIPQQRSLDHGGCLSKYKLGVGRGRQVTRGRVTGGPGRYPALIFGSSGSLDLWPMRDTGEKRAGRPAFPSQPLSEGCTGSTSGARPLPGSRQANTACLSPGHARHWSCTVLSGRSPDPWPQPCGHVPSRRLCLSTL